MSYSTRTVFRFLVPGLIAITIATVNPRNVARGAEQSPAAPSLKVSFAGLDLTKPRGTAILYARIRNAARTVCGSVDVFIWEEKASWNRCVDKAIADAVAKVGDDHLTAYYLARTNRHRAIVTAQTSTPAHAR
jgi:UrcA family protein